MTPSAPTAPATLASRDANRGRCRNVAGAAPYAPSPAASSFSARCVSRFHGTGARTASPTRVDPPAARPIIGGLKRDLTRRSGSVAASRRRTGTLPALVTCTWYFADRLPVAMSGSTRMPIPCTTATLTVNSSQREMSSR